MLFTYKQWLEAVAVGNSVANATMFPPNDNDNNDDDDDEGWDWDNVDKTFGMSIQKWLDTSPDAQKMKGAVLGKVFSRQPEFSDVEIYGDDDSEHELSPQGMAEVRVSWRLPVDDLEQPIINTMRKSDLWRALRVQPNQLWQTLDKGDLANYVLYLFNMSLSGMNHGIVQQYQGTFDQKYFTDKSAWEKDKLTLQKYAAFKSYEMKSEIEDHVRNYVLGMSSKSDVKLNPRRVTPRGQIYQNNYWGEIIGQWYYTIS